MIKQSIKLRSIISDFLLFLSPALIFNLLYYTKFQSVLNGTLLNSYLVFLLWIILTALRLVLALFIPAKQMPLINSALMGSVWISMVAFYSLCMLGLTSWGRVPTIMIIKVYASQIGSIIEILNISVLMLVLLSVVIFGILLLVYRMIWSNTLWLSFLSHQLRQGIALFFFFSVALMGIMLFWQNFYYVNSNYQNEVFFEVFFPEYKAKMMQNWRVNTSKTLESKANSSRDSYKKSNYIPKNVILIVVDAFRADHLPVNGYSRQTMPFISSLQRKGQLQSIGSMRSVCAESSCGVLAISRSKYPNAITAVDFSLYEVLKRYGYQIHFFLSGDHTNFYHLKEAYNPYDTYIDESPAPNKNLLSVNDDHFLLNQLKKLPQFAGTPAFIQFHLMSVHGLGVRYKKDYPYGPSKNYYNAISFGEMQKHGFILFEKGAKKEGLVALKLANELFSLAEHFFCEQNKTQDLASFKQEFTDKLTSKNDEMKQYRASWGTIVLNIAIALTGFGLLALAGQLGFSFATTGRALFFGQQKLTTREERRDEIYQTLSVLS